MPKAKPVSFHPLSFDEAMLLKAPPKPPEETDNVQAEEMKTLMSLELVSFRK